MIVRKCIKDFLAANGESTTAAIVAGCAENGASEKRVERVLDRMSTRGKIVKNGDSYSLPV
jgi:hypothetical protein